MSAEIPSVNNESEEISLKELIVKAKEWGKYILSKWLIIVLFGIVVGVLGYLYTAKKKRMYTATTTFVLESSGEGGGGGLGQYAGLASMVGIDMGGGGGGIFQGDNILELYKSRSMIKKTLFTTVDYNGKSMLLIDRFIDFNQLREGWTNPKLKNINFSSKGEALSPEVRRLQDSIITDIAVELNKNYMMVVKPDRKSSIIRVDIKGPDEFFAKAFNNQIVKNVNDFYVQTKTKKALESVAIVKNKVDSIRAEMNGSIYRAVAISDATPNLNPIRQVERLAPIQRSQFSAETNKLILGELVKNLEMSKMTLLKETPLIQVVDEPILPLYSEKTSARKVGLISAVLGGIFIIIIFLGRKIVNDSLK